MAKYAPLIPLIGGLPLGASAVFGNHPDVIYTYKAFNTNDSIYVNHLQSKGIDVEMNYIDESPRIHNDLDVIVATPPCAGLSSLSQCSHCASPVNDWMIESSRFILEKVQPKVLYGENAPALATNKGRPVALKLFKLAQEYGYTFSLYRTKSLLHGCPQVRNRSFYFFWKEQNKTPLIPYFNTKYTTIEELLSRERNDKDPMDIIVNNTKPSQDP